MFSLKIFDEKEHEFALLDRDNKSPIPKRFQWPTWASDDVRSSGRPKGQATINAAVPLAVEQALKFIDDHTFYPRRMVGLNNLRLDEYPVAALREALVNAVAHRSYEDRSLKVLL